MKSFTFSGHEIAGKVSHFWTSNYRQNRSHFWCENGGQIGGRFPNVFPLKWPSNCPREIKLRLIFSTFLEAIFGPNLVPFWPSFWPSFCQCFPPFWASFVASWNNTSYYFMHILGAHFRAKLPAFSGPFSAQIWAKMVDVSSGIGHQQQPRVRVIILVYVHQWPFRATGAPSVCFCPKGQKHTQRMQLT